MKKTFSSTWGRRILAVFAGLLLTTAFAEFNFAGAAWIAPALILFCAVGANGGKAFRLGYMAGLAHFLSSLSWLLLIPYTWHGIPLGPGVGWLALSLYLALFFGAWVWGCWEIFPGKNPDSSAAASNDGVSIATSIENFLSTTWWQRTWWCFCCAAAWVALEILRGRLLSGFPWNFLGASQFKVLPLIQISSITGVYGVSFLVVWMSMALGCAILKLVRQPNGYRNLFGEIALPLLAVLAVMVFGFQKLMTPKMEVFSELKVVLVQPSIPQSLIWNPNDDAKRFQQTLALAEKALETKPDLMVWPESAMPPATEENIAALTRLIMAHKVWTILCSDDVEVSPENPRETKYFNASFLFAPEGGYVAKYRKQRLVMFGEFVPLVDSLPFLKKFTPIEGGFTPGTNVVQFEIQNPHAKTSVLICFEDMFPHGARTHVERDTDFLLNLTSDAWFGHGAAQWQQAANALFRAVENGLPLVRCTNDGLTCWIDAHGRIREIFHDEAGTIYGPGFLRVTIPLLRSGGGPTFYNRHGDVFGWGCLALVAGVFLVRRLWRR